MTDPLEEQARTFAASLTNTVQRVAPGCSPFHALTLTSGHRERFRVRQEPETGIPLTVDGAPILTLKVSYDCMLDGHGAHMAVDESRISVYAGPKAVREPLFRYEYLRGESDIPSAHIHFHGHRDAITYVMTQSGPGTRRARERQQNDTVPRVAELHFPLGGHRFRPCLEDVLEMLVTELGVDCTDDGRDALRQGREEWRRGQVATVVRDAPDEAIKVLRDLGYEVSLPAGVSAPAGNPTRLRDF